ncbi:restriction endonuclease [Micrococcus antarcticus]
MLTKIISEVSLVRLFVFALTIKKTVVSEKRMSGTMSLHSLIMGKVISAAAMRPLEDALSSIYWYKRDLRRFLEATLDLPELVAQLDWTQYKRTIVGQLVSRLFANQNRYGDNLMSLLLTVSDIDDPAWLIKETDGKALYTNACEAVSRLKKITEPYASVRTEQEEARKRRAEAKKASVARSSFAEALGELRTEFTTLVEMDAQARGYALEPFLKRLFQLFDVETKGSFKIAGEQLDGAFSLRGTEYLLEAKWRKELTPSTDLDAFSSKVRYKLDNTLGLFISINGFQPTAIDRAQRGDRPHYILMDGGDLTAVLEERIALPDLIEKKKQYAARSGEIMISAWLLIGSP